MALAVSPHGEGTTQTDECIRRFWFLLVRQGLLNGIRLANSNTLKLSGSAPPKEDIRSGNGIHLRSRLGLPTGRVRGRSLLHEIDTQGNLSTDRNLADL
jgi:hypothetical protein